MKTWYSDVLEQSDPVMRSQLAKALLEVRKPKPPSQIGCVVEFLRSGRHRCGVVRVTPGRSRSLWVLDQEGRETWVSYRKVVDISREKITLLQRHEIVHALRQIDQRRERAKQALDLRPLWEVALEEPGRKWALNELVELYFGSERDGDDRVTLARLLNEGQFFSQQVQHFLPLPVERVEERSRIANQRQRSREQIEDTAVWLRQVADGQETSRPADAEEAIALLQEAALYGGESERSSEAARLMKRAHLHGPPAAFEVLVKLGHWEADENLELLRSGAPVEFAPEILAAAASLQWLPEAQRSRRWWGRRVYGFSRHGEVCDQAFSVRRTLLGYKVGLHFAAPALLLLRQGAVQGEAMERGASLQLPDQSIPMLPPAILAAAALTLEERRPVLTVEIRLDKNRQIQGYDVGIRRVRLTQVLRWGEADAFLVGDKHLGWLAELARALRQKRLQEGDLILAEPEIDVKVRGGQAALQRLEANAAAPLICEELTRLGRELVGRFCGRHGLAAVYRVESAPAARLVEGDDYDAVRVHAQKKQLLRPVLQTQVPAAGGAKASIDRPLERYEDLLMQQQLVEFIAHGKPAYTQQELQHSLESTLWAREAGEKVSRAARRYWLLKHLEGKVGEEVEAVVLERAGAGLVVQLIDSGLKDFFPPKREVWAVPGDRILLTIKQASARRDLVELERPRPMPSGD